MDIVVVKNLRKTYGSGKKRVEALKGVSFTVKQGEMFGLLGPNGAGKSTLLNILSGLLTKDSGSVTMLGKNPERDSEYVKKRINVASAYSDLHGSLSVEQNLKVFSLIYEIEEPDARIELLLGLFEIKHLRNKKANTLSTGEKTRMILVKGLLNQPKLLLMDEATVGLDPDIADKTRRTIKRYQKSSGCSIIFTSHMMGEVEQLCDRVAFLSKGKILGIDTTKNFKKSIKVQEVELEADTSRLLPILRRQKIKIIKHSDEHVILKTELGSPQVFEILAAASKCGIEIRDMTIHKPDLNDVFIKIMRGKP